MKNYKKVFFLLITVFFSVNFDVSAQVGAVLEDGSKTNTAPATTATATDTADTAATEGTPVSQVTLQAVGNDCDMNAIEAAVLHLEGIAAVNLEVRKGFLVIDYDPKAVTVGQMTQAIDKKDSEEGKPMVCVGKVVPTVVSAATAAAEAETAALKNSGTSGTTPATTGTTPAATGTTPATTGTTPATTGTTPAKQ